MAGNNWIFAYYQQVKNGSVTVGRWIMLLLEMLVKGIEEKRFYFDQGKANRAIEWMEEHCFHVKGDMAPNRIRLETWQKAFVSSIFGIVDENGKRVFREVVLIISRKQGKSLLASSIAKYVWEVDGGYGTDVFCIAPKLDQADIVYSTTWKMMELDPDYQKLKQQIEDSRVGHQKGMSTDELPRRRQSDLYISSTNSMVKKIAFSSKKSDGFSPSLTICDEIAAWSGDRGLKQYEVMTSGTGARSEPLTLSCSTAGYENDSIYDELMKRATAVLLGNSKEKRLLPWLFMIDDIEKWNDINELRKSNPNLGVSISVDFLLEQIAIAEGSLSKKAEFITKYCNLKQNSSRAWMSAQTIMKAFGNEISPEQFRDCYCVGGIDLSQTRDLTACCVIIEKDGKLNVLSHFFLPLNKLEEATQRDGVPYSIMAQRGFLTLSGENFVDYHDCFEWFRMLVEEYQILPLKVGYDRYSADYLTQDMKAYGFHMDDVYQGENLYGVIQETEGLFEDGRFNIGDNDLLKIHLLDSAIKMSNERGRGKLIKVNAKAHIDGTAALLDGMCVRQKYYSEIGEQLLNTA